MTKVEIPVPLDFTVSKCPDCGGPTMGADIGSYRSVFCCLVCGNEFVVDFQLKQVPVKLERYAKP